MTNKIIVLDIDGTLNTHQHTASVKDNFLPPNDDEIDKFSQCKTLKIQYNLIDTRLINSDYVLTLNYIIEKTNADVVISSDWRKSVSLSELKEILYFKGFVGKIVGVTPVNKSIFSPRGIEIKDYIKNNNITSYVILDDRSDMDGLEDHLVLIDPFTGLTLEDADKAIEILCNS